ncbi:hypothetical protein L218DRAFT_947871 [Marasmius fiardii PR-910]|nr:hypothetical protein L218DRAFT_947871 [Marasmius fiardii PR-910]
MPEFSFFENTSRAAFHGDTSISNVHRDIVNHNDTANQYTIHNHNKTVNNYITNHIAHTHNYYGGGVHSGRARVGGDEKAARGVGVESRSVAVISRVPKTLHSTVETRPASSSTEAKCPQTPPVAEYINWLFYSSAEFELNSSVYSFLGHCDHFLAILVLFCKAVYSYLSLDLVSSSFGTPTGHQYLKS